MGCDVHSPNLMLRGELGRRPLLTDIISSGVLKGGGSRPWPKPRGPRPNLPTRTPFFERKLYFPQVPNAFVGVPFSSTESLI